MSLENRVAVITGATGVLGSTLVRELATQGVNLALLDIDPARLETLVQTLTLPASRLFTQTVDLLDLAGTKSAALEILTKNGKIDILLQLVGGWTGGKSLARRPLTTTHSCSTSVSGPASMSFRPSSPIWSVMAGAGWS